ncbi:MAG: thioredoxin [Gemmatimonadota bacterium]
MLLRTDRIHDEGVQPSPVARCGAVRLLQPPQSRSARSSCRSAGVGECGRPLLVDRPIKVSDDDFDKVIAGSDVPVVVDFYADWCGPCRTMAPTFDDLASDRRGEILVTKLDTDRNPRTAARFGIRGIPTTTVFVEGREAARLTGAAARSTLNSKRR